MDSTNQGYKTHTGVDYPNMITPDAKVSTDKMGVDVHGLQTGGSFSGTKQVVNSGSTQSAPVAPAAPIGSPASKVHANMNDFKQITPTKEHGNLYTDDGKTWFTPDGTIYEGKK
jgi:hypothetical protein